MKATFWFLAGATFVTCALAVLAGANVLASDDGTSGALCISGTASSPMLMSAKIGEAGRGYKDVDELASVLGVAPSRDGGITVYGESGNGYSLLEMVQSLVAKMESAAQPRSESVPDN